jgi:hypothetical protein
MAETVFYVAAAIAAVVGAGTGVYSATQRPSGPKAPPPPPPYKPPPLPPPPKKEQAPPPVPGIQEKEIGAGAMDERRRILAALPNATKNTYGGDSDTAAPVVKKRLLGGGVGQETTGV